MTVIESLKPIKLPHVYDLLKEVGVDVAGWKKLADGRTITNPASNPAHCRKWAFSDKGLVVLNVWHDQLKEVNGEVYCEVDPGKYSEDVKKDTSMSVNARNVASRKAHDMDELIKTAYENGWPVRLIIGEGSRRNSNDSVSKPSRVAHRLLDQEPWSVEKYDQHADEWRLIRRAIPRYVDQFVTTEMQPPERHEVHGNVWERNHRVRDAVLKRAAGQCEYCNSPGFKTLDGRIYLETHHVIPLSKSGADHIKNVAALCPNHHREAHHGEQSKAIRDELLKMLEKKQQR